MKLTLMLLFFSFSTYAQICNDERAGSFKGLIGNNCLSMETSKSDLDMVLATREETESFCQKCNNEALNKILEHKDASDEKESAFGKAVLDELQKEVTYISMDLMKMRSTFAFKFDPSKAVKSCNFNSNLIKPKCLTKEQSLQFELQTKKIQSSLATELSSILSGSSEGDGLLTKRKNSCNLNDKTATFVQMRYMESLITPELLSNIRKLNLPPKMTLNEYLKDKKDETAVTVAQLKRHPLFKNLLNDTKQMIAFLKETQSESNLDQIIESLYSPNRAQYFSQDISSRCNQVFSKTSKYLEQVYCKDAPSYVADNIDSMESISGKTFSKMEDSKAENELKTYCSQLNNTKKGKVSFSKIKADINGANDPRIVSQPLNDFKSSAYLQIMGDSEKICKVQETKQCKTQPNTTECKMLLFIETQKDSIQHQKLAKGSSEDINLVLRSMIGDSVPQKDGKPDAEAIALLKSEGILPGGDSSSRSSQPDVSTFHKAVRSSQQVQAPQPQVAKVPVVAPTKTEIDAQSPYSQTAARNFEAEDDSSVTKHEPSSKIKSSSKTNKFSHLSDDEQQRIMDLMKRAKKAGGKSPTASTDEDSSVEAAQAITSGLAAANLGTQVAAAGSGVANVAQAAALAGNGGKKAVLDTIKKASSLNEAMIDANKNRQVATSGPAAGPSEVSLSKISSNENEIKIKVPEAELSQVNEFKEKLKVLLNAHSQEISVAGTDEKFVVRLNNFEIKVVFNKALNTFEANCADDSFPKDYLKTILNYFNVTLKGGSGKREALLNHLKQ